MFEEENYLDSLRLFLLVLTLVTIIGPLCWAYLAYSNNLQGLFLPEVPSDLLKMPEVKYLGYNYNASSRAIFVMLIFLNPYNADLTINGISGVICCHEHGNLLGNFTLANPPITLKAGKSATLTIIVEYTDEGKEHILAHHETELEIQIDLREASIDIQGIVFHGDLESIRIPASIMEG